MNEALRLESERLAFAWERHPRSFLDTYLVADVEDPRINAQSILTRALLADSLFPGQCEMLINHEFAFGLGLTWLLLQRKQGLSREHLLRLLDARDPGLPPFLARLADFLDGQEEIPDYLANALTKPCEGPHLLAESAFDAVSWLWHARLSQLPKPAGKLAVAELACGSANDFRCLDEHGLARFIRYTGFDIAAKNIANARERFPEVDFRVGNALALEAEDGAFQYLIAHDLFEHLSAEGLQRALEEVARVCRGEAWLGFFNLANIPDHLLRPMEFYHWNVLSQPRVLDTLRALGGEVEVISLPVMMEEKFGYSEYYNREAVTLVARFG